MLTKVRDLLANQYVSLVSRLILGGVFLLAGATKALDPGGFAASIRTYELALPEWSVTLTSHSLPYLEILLGLYLLAGLFTRSSAWVASGFMVLFTFLILQGIARGIEVDCGCFGSSAGEGASPWTAVLRDLGLLALGLQLALNSPGRPSLDSLLRRETDPEEPAPPYTPAEAQPGLRETNHTR